MSGSQNLESAGELWKYRRLDSSPSDSDLIGLDTGSGVL